MDGSVTETPKAKKEIISTPPSGPAMLQRRLRDDIEAALCRKSLPLLSLALLRSHCCSADHCVHEAVKRQHVKALQFLLQHSSCLSQVDDHCNAMRPLHTAILHSMSKDGAGFQMAEVLLSFGASANYYRGDDPSLGAPLHVAAKRGNVAMVALLLAHGADPNAHDANGQTPLHMSCRRMGFQSDGVGDQVARLLLSHGANPVRVDALGLSPSDCAHTAGMRQLLRQATKSWAQQQLAPARGAVHGCVDQQVPWILPEILDALASFL
jgi:ankyrin repeat protein